MPISRNMFPVRGNDNGLVILTGQFVGNDASNPTSITFKGVSAVTRSGAGTYTLTLPGTGALNVLSLFAEGNFTSASVWVVPSVVEATRVVTLKIYRDVAGVATLTDATPTDIVSVMAVIKNSRTRS